MPGLNLAARDGLVRARGTLAVPDDIVIVAIDEASLKRYGRFPWARSLTAKMLDVIAAARPKVIALDVLYSEPTTETDDAALVTSIAQAGNVVTASQLIEINDGERRVVWLRPLPEIEKAAAGVGHANVATDFDGVARSLLLRTADDEGQAQWALALETVRVADGLRANDVHEIFNAIKAGTREIPVHFERRALEFAAADSRVETVRASRMNIDYAGPAGSFAANTVSFSDVLEGKVSPEKLRGKTVLIGATAATLGEQVASPFMRSEDTEGNQHGTLTPGVEVLANAVNTILRSRYYRTCLQVKS